MKIWKHRAAVAAEAAVQVDPPTEYYTSRYSGEEIDKGIDGALQLGGASTPQGAIAALGAGVRPNLLINPFFKVNQRGQTTYPGDVYGVDMWRATGTQSTLTVDEDGVTLSVSAEDPSRRLLEQKFEDGTIRDGLDYTLSVLLQNGELYSGTGQFPTASGAYTDVFTIPGIGGGRLNVGNNGVKTIYFIAERGISLSVCAAKLEEGVNQTLAYQDDSGAWQLLEQPDPLELLKCQRYCLVVAPNTSYGPAGSGMAQTESSARVVIPIPASLRINPSITFSGQWQLLANGLSQNVTNMSVAGSSSNAIQIDTASSGLVVGQGVVMRAKGDLTAKIIFSADL